MIETPLSEQLGKIGAAARPFLEFLATSSWSRKMGAEDICDFVVGNPHDPPLAAYVEAITRASAPRGPWWFGYKTNGPEPCRAAADSLRQRLGIDFEKEDIFLTRGASSALFLALSTIITPGEEVFFLSPP